MLNKFRIALAATFVALAAVSAVDSASAANFGFARGGTYFDSGGFLYSCPCP
jgi:hypothetical protein